MPDADELSGTEDMHDMDASAMDQDGERPGEGSLCVEYHSVSIV